MSPRQSWAATRCSRHLPHFQAALDWRPGTLCCAGVLVVPQRPVPGASFVELNHQSDHHRAPPTFKSGAHVGWLVWSPRVTSPPPGSLASPGPAAAPAGHALPGRVSDSGHHSVGSELESEIKPRRFAPTSGGTWAGAREVVSIQSLKSGWSSWRRRQHFHCVSWNGTICLVRLCGFPGLQLLEL